LESLYVMLKMPWYKDYIDDHYQMRPEFIGLKVAVIHNALDNLGWSKVDEKHLNGCYLVLLERLRDKLIVIEESGYSPQVDASPEHLKELENILISLDV